MNICQLTEEITRADRAAGEIIGRYDAKNPAICDGDQKAQAELFRALHRSGCKREILAALDYIESISRFDAIGWSFTNAGGRPDLEHLEELDSEIGDNYETTSYAGSLVPHLGFVGAAITGGVASVRAYDCPQGSWRDGLARWNMFGVFSGVAVLPSERNKRKLGAVSVSTVCGSGRMFTLSWRDFCLGSFSFTSKAREAVRRWTAAKYRDLRAALPGEVLAGRLVSALDSVCKGVEKVDGLTAHEIMKMRGLVVATAFATGDRALAGRMFLEFDQCVWRSSWDAVARRMIPSEPQHVAERGERLGGLWPDGVSGVGELFINACSLEGVSAEVEGWRCYNNKGRLEKLRNDDSVRALSLASSRLDQKPSPETEGQGEHGGLSWSFTTPGGRSVTMFAEGSAHVAHVTDSGLQHSWRINVTDEISRGGPGAAVAAIDEYVDRASGRHAEAATRPGTAIPLIRAGGSPVLMPDGSYVWSDPAAVLSHVMQFFIAPGVRGDLQEHPDGEALWTLEFCPFESDDAGPEDEHRNTAHTAQIGIEDGRIYARCNICRDRDGNDWGWPDLRDLWGLGELLNYFTDPNSATGLSVYGNTLAAMGFFESPAEPSPQWTPQRFTLREVNAPQLAPGELFNVPASFARRNVGRQIVEMGLDYEAPGPMESGAMRAVIRESSAREEAAILSDRGVDFHHPFAGTFTAGVKYSRSDIQSRVADSVHLGGVEFCLWSPRTADEDVALAAMTYQNDPEHGRRVLWSENVPPDADGLRVDRVTIFGERGALYTDLNFAFALLAMLARGDRITPEAFTCWALPVPHEGTTVPALVVQIHSSPAAEAEQ